MESKLPELRKLTETLNGISSQTYSPNIIKYQMKKGTAISFGMLNEPAISCAKTFGSAGSIFPLHSHPEKEFVVVYVGSMSIIIEGKDTVLNVGDCISILPEAKHYTVFHEDSWVIAGTIPQTEGYPAAPKGA